jgi:hypothetical protein
MKRLLYLLFIFCALGAKAQQSLSINGTVTDEKGAPLPGATVFITNSKYVTIANNSGKFSFANLPPGTYEVVIKLLGFLPYVQSVTVNSTTANITAKLKESITTLNTVTISASRDRISEQDREKYLEIFIKNFIGETVNSQQCRLLNPEVLQFHFDNKTHLLRASADDFLIIENKALGYKLKYLLLEFRVDFEIGTCTNSGYPYFEELKGSPAQEKKWENNRRTAYLSSDRHFFNALVNNTLQEEGYAIYKDTVVSNSKKKPDPFKVFEVKDLKNSKSSVFKVLNTDSLFLTDKYGYKKLISKPKIRENDTTRSALLIVYTGENEQALFYKTGYPIFLRTIPRYKKRQISIIHPLADTVTIDRNNGLMPAKGFISSGYWAWQKIADLTPLDYSVEPPNKKQNNLK